MGVYYYLVNDTRHEKVHLDGVVKLGTIANNKIVHFAMMSYIVETKGDSLRFISDDEIDRDSDYKDVDLIEYEFFDNNVTKKLKELLT